MTDVTNDVVDIIAKKKRVDKPTVELTDRLEDLRARARSTPSK